MTRKLAFIYLFICLFTNNNKL